MTEKKKEELAEYIQQLSDRGVYVAASNSEPKNTDLDDNFLMSD